MNFLFLQAPLLVSACVGIGPVGNTSPSRSSPSTTWSGSSRSNMSRMRNPSWRYPTIFKISQYMNKQMSKKCAFLSRILILFLCFASSPNLQIYFQKCQSNFQVFKAARLSLFPHEETLDAGHIMHFGGPKTLQWGQKLSHLMPSSHGATLPQWRESELHFTCNRLNAILHVSLRMSPQIYLANSKIQLCQSDAILYFKFQATLLYGAVWLFLQFLCRYSAAAEANCIGMCHLLNRKSEIRYFYIYFYWQIVSFVEFVLRFKS